jgi:hypothetical protein
MTPEVIAKLEEAFAWGCTDVEACLWADIADDTLYKYQRENPEFIKRKAKLKETPVLLARKTVVNAIKKGDRDTAMKYLERKKKDEFSLRQEMTGKDGKDLPTPIITLEGDSVYSNDSNEKG